MRGWQHPNTAPAGAHPPDGAIDGEGDAVPTYRAPTAGTRIAVWMFPALTLWLGLGYLFADPRRLSSPAFEAAKQVWSMETWGLVFTAVAVIKIACLLTNRPRGFVVAMCVGMGLYAWWAFLFAASFFADVHTSPGAAAWALFVVGSHAAALATLRASGASVKKSHA